MVGAGTLSGFGVFVIPMSTEFDWSRSSISLAAASAALIGGCSQPFMGRIFDKVGGRKLILIGLTVLAFSNILLSFTNHILYMILVFGVLMSLGSSAGTMNTAGALAAKWFHRKRATAVSLISAGTSLGGLILVPFVAFMIPFIGWRSTWFMLGCIILFFALPVAYLIIKNDPADIGQLPDGHIDPPSKPLSQKQNEPPLAVNNWKDAFKSAPLWQLSGGYLVCGFTTTMMSTHYVPYAIEQGVSASTAAMAFAVLSALNTVGVLGAGILGDRFGRKNLLALVYALRAVGYAVLVMAPGLWGLFGFAVIGGVSWLATVPLTTSLTAEIYGLRQIGTLSGVIFMVHQIGGTVSIQFAGIMQDITGSYTLPFAVVGLFLVVASIVSFGINEKRYSSRALLKPSNA